MLSLDKEVKPASQLPQPREFFSNRARQLPLPFSNMLDSADRKAAIDADRSARKADTAPAIAAHRSD